MDVGMLWFDADPRTEVSAKIQKAAEYYRSKYGRTATLCFLHPSADGGLVPAKLGALQIRTSRSVLLNHFWLGIGERGESRGEELQAAA
jgi:hypothetical protein